MKRRAHFVALALAFSVLPIGLRAQTRPGPFRTSGAETARRPAGSAARKSVETYGTADATWYTVDASELSPLVSGNQYSGAGNLRYLTNVAGLGFVAPVHLPAGAQLLDFYVYGSDTSSTGEYQASLIVCDNAGEVCSYMPGDGCADAPVTVCSGNAFDGGRGYALGSLQYEVIDNLNFRYFIAAGNTTTDGTTSIGEILIGYSLQVSPAPAAASFTDVPTTDPAFQYIEAVAASGITAGCGGGNFCPDSPITRRQMAVFLARALGLQWN